MHSILPYLLQPMVNRVDLGSVKSNLHNSGVGLSDHMTMAFHFGSQGKGDGNGGGGGADMDYEHDSLCMSVFALLCCKFGAIGAARGNRRNSEAEVKKAVNVGMAAMMMKKKMMKHKKEHVDHDTNQDERWEYAITIMIHVMYVWQTDEFGYVGLSPTKYLEDDKEWERTKASLLLRIAEAALDPLAPPLSVSRQQAIGNTRRQMAINKLCRHVASCCPPEMISLAAASERMAGDNHEKDGEVSERLARHLLTEAHVTQLYENYLAHRPPGMYLEALALPEITAQLKHKINRRRADDDALSEFLEAMWDQRQRKLRFEGQLVNQNSTSNASERKECAQMAVGLLMHSQEEAKLPPTQSGISSTAKMPPASDGPRGGKWRRNRTTAGDDKDEQPDDKMKRLQLHL